MSFAFRPGRGTCVVVVWTGGLLGRRVCATVSTEARVFLML
jgi:hypothetical protein